MERLACDAGLGQFLHPDMCLRNPDNLDWADNGVIYVQEDRIRDGPIRQHDLV